MQEDPDGQQVSVAPWPPHCPHIMVLHGVGSAAEVGATVDFLVGTADN